MYTPVTIDRFGSLNVIDDPQEVGAAGAVDLLNVAFDQPGRIRTRDGSSILAATAAANAIVGGSYYITAGGTEQIVVADNATIRPYALSGGAAGTTRAAVISGGNNGFARFGDPSNTLLYAGEATTPNVQRYDGAAWSNVAAPFAVAFLAVTAADNRLVIAGSGTDSKVHFSDAGAPETFGANNFVRVSPGDGERMTALATWRELTFAFKQTKFAVFTATSTNVDGSPIFNTRGVVAGQGASVGAVAVGEDGVYFANRSGVYVTTGDRPRYLSRPLEPWIKAGALGALPSISLASCTLAYLARKLYINDSTNRTALVYDVDTQAWTVWQLAATSVIAVPPSSSLSAVYFGENSTLKVWKIDPATTTDNGTAIAWRYQSGYYAPANDRRIKLRGSSVWGTGTVTLQMLTQGGRTLDVVDPGGAITLGTAPTVAEGKRRRSCRGVLLAHKLSGTGPASVSRITHRFYPPGLDT